MSTGFTSFCIIWSSVPSGVSLYWSMMLQEMQRR